MGSTINDMETRFMSHLCSAERGKFAHNKLAPDIRKHGRGHFRVTKLEDYSSQSKEQLWRRESEYIVKYDSVDNGCNTMFPDRSMRKGCERCIEIKNKLYRIFLSVRCNFAGTKLKTT
jgi:hypothetical protein